MKPVLLTPLSITLSKTAANALRPWLTYPAWGVCAALAILAPLFPAEAKQIEFYPFAVGLILLGLPHGALDHLALPRLRHQPFSLRSQAPFLASYVAVLLLYLVFWRGAPLLALAVFLVLSWLHWGQGDYAYQRLFEGRVRPKNWAGILLIWLVRGGLPILLPILAWPAVFARVGTGLTRWYGGSGLPMPGQEVIFIGIALLLLLTFAYLLQSWRDAGGAVRGFGQDMGEVCLLWILFWRVPPILAVGTYFCIWHSARHLGRLMLLDPVAMGQLDQGQVWKSAVRIGRESLPMTGGALVFLAGLYALQKQHGPASLPGLVFLYLSLIAALTVPHFLVVLWMDRQQRL